MNTKQYLLSLPSPEEANSGSEYKNIVCASCNRCFEHANSGMHNNICMCLCNSCREAIRYCAYNKINDLCDALWKDATDRNEVCIEYSYYAEENK